jgi:hypothetical protein
MHVGTGRRGRAAVEGNDRRRYPPRSNGTLLLHLEARDLHNVASQSLNSLGVVPAGFRSLLAPWANARLARQVAHSEHCPLKDIDTRQTHAYLHAPFLAEATVGVAGLRQ